MESLIPADGATGLADSQVLDFPAKLQGQPQAGLGQQDVNFRHNWGTCTVHVRLVKGNRQPQFMKGVDQVSSSVREPLHNVTRSALTPLHQVIDVLLRGDKTEVLLMGRSQNFVQHDPSK